MKISSSRLPLLRHCAYPFRPDVAAPPDPPGEAAQFGSRVAETVDIYFSDATASHPPVNTREGAHFWALYSWLDSIGLLNLAWRTEVPYAYDHATGVARELPRGALRDYSTATAMELCGSADMIAYDDEQLSEPRVVVLDVKTGNPEHVDPASENWQVLFYALCAMIVSGVSRALVGLVYLSDSGAHADLIEISEMDIAYFEELLITALGRIGGAIPAPGPHCASKFCPVRGVCPATRQTADELMLAGSTAIEIGRLLQLYERAKVVEKMIDVVKQRVREEVERAGTVPLPSGKVLTIDESSREYLSSKSILDALGKERGGAEVLRLRELGCIKESRFVRLTERNPR